MTRAIATATIETSPVNGYLTRREPFWPLFGSEDVVPHQSAEMTSHLSAIAAALARPSYRIRFGRLLERQFEHASQPGRNRSLRAVLVCGAAMQIALLVLTAVTQPEMLLLFCVPSVVAIAACLAGMALLTADRPIWLQNAAAIVPVVAFIAAETFKGVNAAPAYSDRMLVTAGLMGCFANLIIPMRFHAAVLCSGLGLLAYAGIVLGGIGHPPPNQVPTIIVSGGAILLSLGIAWRHERSGRQAFLLGRRAALLADELAHLARTDPLTGLANRRVFDEALEHAWRAAPAGWVGLIIADIDHFKSFNDSAGHAEGDRCLRLVAEGMRANVRENDTLARFGGEEFAVVLPHTYPDDAFDAAERLRAGVERLALRHPVHGTVTVSVGVAALQPREAKGMPMALLKAADDALYRAKQSGRNRVAVTRAPRLAATGQERPARHSIRASEDSASLIG